MHTTWTLNDFFVMFFVYVVLPLHLQTINIESIDETISSLLDGRISKKRVCLINIENNKN